MYRLSLDNLKVLLIGIQLPGWESIPRWQQQTGSTGAKPYPTLHCPDCPAHTRV